MSQVPLAVLLEGMDPAWSPGAETVLVGGVACDSRRLAPGDLFVAFPGGTADGHDYLEAAGSAGAAAAVVERGDAAPTGLPTVRVADARRALGPIAARFHGRPAERMRLAGITGTNGKTTTAWLLDGLFHAAWNASLLAGTVTHRARIGRGADARTLECAGPGLTTREASDFQAFLAEAEAAGCRAGAVECSSHGLAQGRLLGTRFRAAVFMNLTRDHLDFHPDFESYYRAKRRLFTESLADDGTAVVCLDDPHGRRLARELRTLRPDARVIGFGEDPTASVRIRGVESGLDGLHFRLQTENGSYAVTSPLVGAFNALNLAAAWAAATALGMPGEQAADLLGQVTGPPGRMERIVLPASAGSRPAHGSPTVLVDYAHTPDALARALAEGRVLVGAGRLAAVFGCGGDRDREKRPLMGDAAARLADRVVVTSDNPRSEDPASIIADIRLGADNPLLGATIEAEPDRRRAIERTVADAAPADLVVIAGRGHEGLQAVADRRIPLDDRVLAREAIRQRALA